MTDHEDNIIRIAEYKSTDKALIIDLYKEFEDITREMDDIPGNSIKTATSIYGHEVHGVNLTIQGKFLVIGLSSYTTMVDEYFSDTREFINTLRLFAKMNPEGMFHMKLTQFIGKVTPNN